jgi:hypothetical protein
VRVSAPALLAGYFWWRGDRLAVVLMVAWVGMSLNNVSVCIHDATMMVLPLFGDDGWGAGHDWRFILGELGWLEHTDSIAALARLAAVAASPLAWAWPGWFAREDLRPISRGGDAGVQWAGLPRRLR